MLSLEKRKLRGDIIIFQFLKCGCKEDGDTFSTRSHKEMMRGNGHKLFLGRFWLDTGRKFSTMRTISHWNNLLRKVGSVRHWNFSKYDTFKVQLDSVLGLNEHLIGHAEVVRSLFTSNLWRGFYSEKKRRPWKTEVMDHTANHRCTQKSV